MPKIPLHPAEAERVQLALGEISTDLREIETQLSDALLVRSMPVKAVRRAMRALAAAERALDQTASNSRPTQTSAPRPIEASF